MSLGQVVIIKRNGEDSQLSFPLGKKQEIIIGREFTCDIRVQIAKVSRQHCKIVTKDDKVSILTICSLP
jgi:pSer/pThr/pTyr-binding forkhead associated (FHA) protein